MWLLLMKAHHCYLAAALLIITCAAEHANWWLRSRTSQVLSEAHVAVNHQHDGLTPFAAAAFSFAASSTNLR